MANGWYLTVPVPGIMSDGLFETLEGVNKQSGIVETVDAGTNQKYKFSDQLVDYGEMTLTRPYQANAADRAMEVLVNTCIVAGLKLPVKAVKMHHGKEVLTILFEGFSFHSMALPTLDVSSTEKFIVTYTATCDGWTPIPVGI